MIEFTIYGQLDGLNKYTNANRYNKFAGNNMKQLNQNIVINAIREAKLPKVYKYPIKLQITWYEPNMKRDSDNIASATKFILDGLVKCEILENDSQKFVNELHHIILVDKSNPRIVVKMCYNK